MTWKIIRYENYKEVAQYIVADSFDEAIEKARRIHSDFCAGYVVKRGDAK